LAPLERRKYRVRMRFYTKNYGLGILFPILISAIFQEINLDFTCLPVELPQAVRQAS
jgi:hypothetical protein